MIISQSEVDDVINGACPNPHQWLGLHALGEKGGLVARCWDPTAEKIDIIELPSRKKFPMVKIHDDGLFECEFKRRKKLFRYRLHSTYEGGSREWTDPYTFLPYITDQSLRAFNEGWDRKPYEKLGAIPANHQGVDGVSFVVWAPSAQSVHLVGDFNHWNPRAHPMRSLGSSGCREIFLPAAQIGDKYKYRIVGADGVVREKTDPFGWCFEPPMGNASIVQTREYPYRNKSVAGEANPRTDPISIYEMHLGSWKYSEKENRPLSYLELADSLPSYLRDLGFTHVEFLPPSEYPFGASWGYQVTGYYAPTYRYGTPAEFSHLIDALHQNNIGVIIDWVPGHFPADEFSLARFDGTCLFEHEDPKQGLHAEWGTLCYNYGRPEVRSFLIGSAIAWMERFGVDGYRVDAVASMLYLDYARKEDEWIPNIYGGNENLEAIDFIKQFNHAVHEECPHLITIAEESTSFPQITNPPSTGGLGFDFKWNMGWMHDVLDYFSTEPDHRQHAHNQLTFGAMYQFSENFVQAFSHDEVVHGKGSLVNKMNLAYEEDRIANLRALLSLQWAWPGKKTLFMGCEFAQWAEWNFEAPLDWALLDFPLHSGLQRLVADLNKLYCNHPTWARGDHEGSKFHWIDCNDSERQTLSFLKFGSFPSDTLLIACNFSGEVRHRDWGCPHPGKWRVILDSDAPIYGGWGGAGADSFDTFESQRDGQSFGLAFSVGRWSVRVLQLIEESLPQR